MIILVKHPRSGLPITVLYKSSYLHIFMYRNVWQNVLAGCFVWLWFLMFYWRYYDNSVFSPWRIVDDCGGAFAMGAIGGSVFHSIKGFRHAPSVRYSWPLIVEELTFTTAVPKRLERKYLPQNSRLGAGRLDDRLIKIVILKVEAGLLK